MERKPDDLAIGAFFDELARQPWLGYRRRRWPEFFFHVTDVQNAASILSSGRLLCRSQAKAESLMVTDNASSDVLEQSGPWLFDQVRLYFRPRTPTFWRNEGIRPVGYREYDAHCPMPVALLFDAKSIAGRTGVQFSDGNLASLATNRGIGVDFLQSLDFRDIYNDGPLSIEEKERIRRARQAEVIVSGELALDALRHVVTRSDAERQTLIDLVAASRSSRGLLPEDVGVKPELFHCRWSFIERATLAGEAVRLDFNPDSATPCPFSAQFTWLNRTSGNVSITEQSMFGSGSVQVTVPAEFRGLPVHLTVHLDDALAFAGTLERVPSSTLLTLR